jgi:hydrogenase-4 membrane subunit HyfE
MSAPETYYDVAMRRLDRQAELSNSVDSKAALILAAAGTLLPVFGVLVAVFDKDPSRWSIALYVLAFVLYLAMVSCVLVGLRIREWSIRPDLPTLAGYAREQNEASVRVWVADQCAKSIAANQQPLRRKAHYIDWAVILLTALVLTLSSLAIIEMIG